MKGRSERNVSGIFGFSMSFMQPNSSVVEISVPWNHWRCHAGGNQHPCDSNHYGQEHDFRVRIKCPGARTLVERQNASKGLCYLALLLPLDRLILDPNHACPPSGLSDIIDPLTPYRFQGRLYPGSPRQLKRSLQADDDKKATTSDNVSCFGRDCFSERRRSHC